MKGAAPPDLPEPADSREPRDQSRLDESRGLAAPARSFGARIGSNEREAACLAAIFLLAAADRLVNLPARGIWDSDQGTQMAAIWNAVVTGRLPTFGPMAYSTGGAFHHGALFYDLMIPAAWLSNGNPAALVFAVALFGVAVVPLVWWTARSIGGPAAGLAAALLAAVSPSLIGYSTFLWNPVLLETGTALACLGAWQAWRTHQPRWWLVAASGTALASQAHLTGLVLVLPMATLFAMALRRGPSGERRRLLTWGFAGAGLFVLTWLPLILYELGHDFAETRAMLAFNQPSPPAGGPLAEVAFGSMRIVVWPLMYWPLDDFRPGAALAFVAAVAVVVGVVWRVAGSFARGQDTAHAADHEREGVRFVGGSLLVIALVLSLCLKQISQVEPVDQEQYHSVADVLVIIGAALVVGGLWREARASRAWLGRSLAIGMLAGLTVLGVSHWPPLTSPDGGWPAAHAAAQRLEADAQGGSIALINLPAFKSAAAYSYPLSYDGATLATPGDAGTVVVLCDSEWVTSGCGDPTIEARWLSSASAGQGLQFVERFSPAPNRSLSVYRRVP